jgi:hypothetical protein
VGLCVVVVVDAVELFGDTACGTVAEGAGDVAFLPGRLHSSLVEQGGGAGDGRDLRVDVDDGLGEPFLLALPRLNVVAVDAQQFLSGGPQLADLLGDPVGVPGQGGVGGVEPVGPVGRRSRRARRCCRSGR